MVDKPVWDGEGKDPWMPQRLAAQAEAVAGERNIYDDYLARLSRWLVDTRRAIMRSPVVDPETVWSTFLSWVDSMTEFVHSSIADLVGTAYRKALGPGYPYSQKPHVTAYLAEAQNRLLGVPAETYDRIAGEIAVGAGMGESMDQIAKRVDGALSMTATPYWPNRAVVVARTETMGALNAGRSGAYQAVAAELGEPFEQGWLATHDPKTRPTHKAADIGTPITGQRVPVGISFLVGGFLLDQPGDPKGPPQEVIQCRCTTVLLRPGEMVDLSDRQLADY
jgi:F like protein